MRNKADVKGGGHSDGEFLVVVVEEARSQADFASGGDVGQGRVVVGAVEISDGELFNQLMLQRPQGRWRPAADHERPSLGNGDGAEPCR